MLLTHTIDYGLVWPTWLAWAGIGLMGAVLLLVAAMRRPGVAGRMRMIFLRSPTLRGRLLLGFGIVALVPILTLPPLIGANSAQLMQDQQIGALEGVARAVADSLPRMVANRIDGVSGLAQHISAGGDFSESVLAEWLVRHHVANTEIVSMWIARPDGHVIVATAARQGKVERWGGPIAGVGVMDYFQAAVEQGGKYVSTVRKGVAAGSNPMVFVSAPLRRGIGGRDGDRPWGYLQAQLDLSKVFGHFVMPDAKAGSDIVMTDAQDRVMLSSPRLRFRQFESIAGHPLLLAMNRRAGATSFGFEGTIGATGEHARYVAAYRQLPRGWKVFAIAAQEPVRQLAVLPLVLGGVWAVLALLLARGFASLFGDALAQPLKTLDESLDVFDAERTISIIPQAPSDAPSEVHEVYAKVRDSMRKSRDAYRGMMRALNEGVELKQRLRQVSGHEMPADTGAMVVVEDAPSGSDLGTTSASRRRIDAANQVPGHELFREFFDEAWNLGVVAAKPLALILLAVGTKDEQTLKSVTAALGDIGGRTLDLIARVGVHEFAVVLPETDLQGGLAVAGRAQLAVREMLRKIVGDSVPEINFGVLAILPNPNGNAKSFIDFGRRVLKASHDRGDGFIAYADDKGKIRLATEADVVDWDQDVG